MYKYKKISIYFDASKKLIGVPIGSAPFPKYGGKYGRASLDIFFVLEPGYSDEELEHFINEVFDACYSKKFVDGEPTAIQKYTGAKSYVAAVKGYQLMNVDWIKDDGYAFVPMMVDSKHRGAFTSIKGVSVKAMLHSKFKPVEKGALALAFKKAMEIIFEES